MNRPVKGMGRGRTTRTALNAYLEAIRRYHLLTSSGEHRVAVQSWQGVEQARRALVEANLRLVVKIAMSYKTATVGVEDLVSEGNIGLIEAARRFDPSRGVRFASYAAWWIRKYMVAALNRHRTQSSSPIETSSPTGGTRRTRGKADAVAAGGPHPKRQRLISYDAFLTDSGEFQVSKKRVQDGGVGPEGALLEMDLAEALRSILDRMPPNERKILEARFGLDGEPRRTLREIGDALGCTRERVRRLEIRALERARRLLGGKQR
jgi:RNA polymerase primary sigma factor